MSAPQLRVVVRLPGTRPENPIPDPPQIEWTQEKADILWKVIERSRSSDSGGADWKGLAAHLEVPLPYLLYRVNARFQEEIRGLKDIQDTLSPTGTQPNFPSPLYAVETAPVPPTSPRSAEKPGPSALQRIQTKLSASSRLSTSSRMNTPLGVRARLNSLTNNVHASSPRRASASDNATLNANSNSATSKKGVSSSTLTLQADSKRHHPPIRNADPFSESSDEDSDEEELQKEEEADRAAEEQETLARRLEELQRMMTNEAIGLVSSARPRRRSLTERGRLGALSPRSVGSSYRGNGHDTLSSSGANSASRSAGRGSGSHSQSLSEVGSPQGSIPDIPSPQGSQPHSPRGHRFYNDGRTAGSPNGGLGPRYGPLQNGNGQMYHAPSDDYGSSHGSETSSFTDLSDASVSASALESALMSNIRGGGSRMSQFGPSRMISRSSRGPR